MTPRKVLEAWINAFNAGDVNALADLYAEGAVNHQVADAPVQGRDAIRRMFANAFAAAQMICVPENIFVDGEWAILEWRDPMGLRGSGFFRILEGKIVFQRGYWDKLTFLKLHGLEELDLQAPVASQ